jgi:hypothetical protein
MTNQTNDAAPIEPRDDAIPDSFRKLSAAERKERKRQQAAYQLTLGAEPDHTLELEAQRAFDDKRGPAQRDAFRKEVARLRLDSERSPRGGQGAGAR